MKFSVLIPVYNVETYLQQCLDSVINQTFDDYEIIIVDDGSTDSSGRICDEFKKHYPNKVKLIHKENKGLISARREAIKKAQGEFCVFVDSDDFVETNLLETVNNYLQKDNEIDMVIYSFFYYGEKEKKRNERYLAKDSTIWSGEEKSYLCKSLIASDIIDALWIKAIKTEYLQRDPIDYSKYYNKNMSEDTLQSIYPLDFAKKIIYADVPLYNYRYNFESISRNYSSKNIEKKDSSHVFREILKILPDWKLDAEFEKRLYARWFADVMYIFTKTCENAKSKEDWTNIFNTNWVSMLPDVEVKIFEKYTNQQYVKIYNWFADKAFYKLKLHFLKSVMYKKYKKLKVGFKGL